MNKQLTLSVITRDDKILLGLKKRGFGMGKWNGFGGKVQQGEAVVECMKRELFEEASIVAEELDQVGHFYFTYEGDDKIHEVHVFKIENFVGEPAESAEMLPRWFDLKEIPYEEMWADDKYWLPRVLTGEKLQGIFNFSMDGQILKFELLNISSNEIE